jgi:trehalose-phosphatase
VPAAAEELLNQLRKWPEQTAILTDVDGTIAPIAQRPEDAALLPGARELLETLAGRYALVACISGRGVLDARRLVGVDGIAYVGNHGFERLLPGDGGPSFDPALDGHERDAGAFVATLDPSDLESHELRLEDKGPIQALHWRGAADEGAAESRAHEIAADAEWRNLDARWGRKVLEIRPPIRVGKGEAIAGMLEERGLAQALYGGDDRTDLEAFAALRALNGEGRLDLALCVGVISAEGPPELNAAADLSVDGPEGFVELLRRLAE